MDMRQLRHDSATWQILEERAQLLAHQELDDTEQLTEEFLAFRLSGGLYRVAARLVREVQLLHAYTRLPKTPPIVLGLVNVRGRLLTAFDLRPLLSLPNPPPRNESSLLIVSNDGLDVGLLVDEVVEISRIDPFLAPSIGAIDGQPTIWILGIDRELAVRIDIPSLLEYLQQQIGAFVATGA